MERKLFDIILTIVLLPLINMAYASDQILDFTPQTINLGDKTVGLLVEKKDLPIVAVSISFNNAGNAYIKDGKYGIADLLSMVMETGAGNLTEEQISTLINRSGKYFNITADLDSFNFSFTTTDEYIEDLFNLVNLMLSVPKFTKDDINIAKSRLKNRLKSLKDHPAAMAQIEWYKQYMSSHSYGKYYAMISDSTIDKISKKDLINFIANNLTKDNLQISIAGNLNVEKANSLINKYFSNLSNKVANIRQEGEFNYANKLKIINNKTQQAEIIFGDKYEINFNSKDIYTLNLLNFILGGRSFESRLLKEIRQKRGLTYAIYTSLLDFNYANLMQGTVATKNENVNEVIRIIKSTIKDLKDNNITEEELDFAKNFLSLSFPLNLDTNSKVVSYLKIIQKHNLGYDFINNFMINIKKVELEDVRQLTNKILDPDNLVFLVVGDESIINQNSIKYE